MKVLLSEWLPSELVKNLSVLISEAHYLEKNEDVKSSGTSATEHYLNFGWQENRSLPLWQSDGDVVQIESFLELKSKLSELFDEKFSKALELDIGEFSFQRGVIGSIFDEEFYEEQIGFKIPKSLRIEHFLLVGRYNGATPNRYFVPVEYAGIYSDISNSDVDETYHYAVQGLKEGRFPRILDSFEKFSLLPIELITIWTSEFFDSEFYLQNNSDVLESGIEPLHHYCHSGWKEGREPNSTQLVSEKEFDLEFFSVLNLNPSLVKHILQKTGFSLISDEEREKLYGKNESEGYSELAYEVETVKQHVDDDFYFRLYPDVQTSGLSAAEHYCKFGWREQRDPSALFSTKFYLEDNPDVLDAGVNPLFHYIVAGQFERRYPQRPGGLKADSIYNLIPLSKKKEHWKVNIEPTLVSKVDFKIDKKCVVSISHDRYTEHTGGVQLCILKEQKAYNSDKIDYFHLAPFQPLPTLADESAFKNNAHYLHLTINGYYKGVVEASTVIDIFGSVSDGDFTMVYHALHGHSTEFLKKLVSLDNFSKTLLWIHDYFTICEGYNLLRNEVSPCRAPLPDSKACNICVFGQKRAQHITRINSLLSEKNYTAIAPSEAAKETWLADRGVVDRSKMLEVIVKNHVSLVKEHSTSVESSKPIKVAFIGYPSIHKGWAEFSKFVRETLSSGRYEYFHIGAQRKELPGVDFIECSVTSANPELMTETVRTHDIDYVYLAAPWAETFNIVCYEVIAAGALVITQPGSGNVARFIESSGNGVIVSSVEELIEKNEKLLKKTTKKTYYSTQFSDMGHGI